MKDDLIKRSDAVAAIANLHVSHDREEIFKAYAKNPHSMTTDFEGTLIDAINAVEALPSADRPQGEWIRTGRTNIYGGIEVQCSNCGDRVMVQHLEDEWYCRHCGADMGMKGADDGRNAD